MGVVGDIIILFEFTFPSLLEIIILPLFFPTNKNSSLDNNGSLLMRRSFSIFIMSKVKDIMGRNLMGGFIL
jgi:hypothetical protein